MTTEQNDGSYNPDNQERRPQRLIPTLGLVREKLAANSNVMALSEQTEKEENGEVENILEIVRIRISPVSPMQNPDDLTQFLRSIFSEFDSRYLQETGGDVNLTVNSFYETCSVALPRLKFYETLGLVREEVSTKKTGMVMDSESLEKYDKHLQTGSQEEKKDEVTEYLRAVEVVLYPDATIAEFCTRRDEEYKAGEKIEISKEEKKRFAELRENLMFTLFKKWRSGELKHFFLDGEALTEDEKREKFQSYFFQGRDVAELLRINDGSPAGDRLLIATKVKDFTPGNIADIAKERTKDAKAATEYQPRPRVKYIPEEGTLGFLLNGIRTNMKLTQAQLAKKVGLNQAYISGLERNERIPLGRQRILLLATALGLDEETTKKIVELYNNIPKNK